MYVIVAPLTSMQAERRHVSILILRLVSNIPMCSTLSNKGVRTHKKEHHVMLKGALGNSLSLLFPTIVFVCSWVASKDHSWGLTVPAHVGVNNYSLVLTSDVCCLMPRTTPWPHVTMGSGNITTLIMKLSLVFTHNRTCLWVTGFLQNRASQVVKTEFDYENS